MRWPFGSRWLTVALAAAIAAALAATGCGGGDAATTAAPAATVEGAPVSDDQALVLARVLERNWRRGGARVAGTLPIDAVEVTFRGRVDFRAGRGAITMHEPNGDERSYRWSPTVVHAQAARDSADHVEQRPNPDGDPVHALIAFLSMLSAETVDNTANIIDQGARYLGRELLDGVDVDRYRYGGQGLTTYWVDRDEGLLRRVDARFPGGTVSVRLSAHGPVRVRFPASSRGG